MNTNNIEPAQRRLNLTLARRTWWHKPTEWSPRGREIGALQDLLIAPAASPDGIEEL